MYVQVDFDDFQRLSENLQAQTPNEELSNLGSSFGVLVIRVAVLH